MNAALADALQGIRVLDLSRLLPGPFLTMVLADMGADVIKVEDPRMGDYLRGLPPLLGKSGMAGRFLAINRGKRSIALDLKVAAAREAFLKLVEHADVVVESFRPGVMDKLGLSYATLSARNPKIVVCSISYGQTGPYVERAGHGGRDSRLAAPATREFPPAAPPACRGRLRRHRHDRQRQGAENQIARLRADAKNTRWINHWNCVCP